VAEREGFEPAVRFCRTKARRVRKLQIAKHYQKNFMRKPTSELGNQSGFDSPSIRTQTANARRFCGKNGHVAGFPGSLGGFAGDCLPTAQSESEKSIRRECSKKGK